MRSKAQILKTASTLKQFSNKIKNAQDEVLTPETVREIAEEIKEVAEVATELAEEILQANKADLIGFGRAFLIDSEWPQKAANGRSGDIEFTANNGGVIIDYDSGHSTEQKRLVVFVIVRICRSV